MTRLLESVGRFFTCFSRGKETGDDKTAEEYLQLRTKCMEEARTRSLSPSLRFNGGQCRYLVDKLEASIQSARPLLEPRRRFDHAGLVHYLQVFKFLYSLAREVESFVQTCCNDAWIEAAVFKTNVSQHISSIGFNLEVFAIAFSKSNGPNGIRSLTSTEVARVHKAEVETVKKEAFRDTMKLRRKVNSFIESSKSSDRWDLPHFLLESPEQSSSPPESSPSNLCVGYFRNLKRCNQIGKGAFATVCGAEWLGLPVATKTFIGDAKYFDKELAILSGLSRPNIIRLFGYKKAKGRWSCIMERMDGDLRSLIDDRSDHEEMPMNKPKDGLEHEGPFKIMEAIDIMHQVAEGVLYLHENKIVHRDLKSANILYLCVGTAVHVKVADFGSQK